MLRLASLLADNARPIYERLAGYVAERLAVPVSLLAEGPREERFRRLDAGDVDVAFLCGLKGMIDGGLINGGFFVCEPEMLDLLDGDDTVFEQEPMERLIDRGKLASYHHHGYWQSMDSLRDKQVLEAQWADGAPWRVWDK